MSRGEAGQGWRRKLYLNAAAHLKDMSDALEEMGAWPTIRFYLALFAAAGLTTLILELAGV